MCDFHSIVVRKDGTKAHIPGNSHSGAVAAAKWRENQPHRDAFFVECEWDGEGEYPGAASIARSEINTKQRKVIDAHYGALAAVINDPKANAERLCLGTGMFASEEYADIRFMVLMHDECPKSVARKLCKTSLFAKTLPTKRLPDTITRLTFPENTHLDLRGYAHALPAGLSSVGGYLYLGDYAHALPAGLKNHPKNRVIHY